MDQRVRFQEVDAIVPRRPVPLDHLLVTATSSGTAQTFTTVRDKVLLQVKQLCAANITGSAATLTLHSIPLAGSIGDGNAEMKAVSIPANSIADITPYISGLYRAGTVLKAYSGTGSALVLHGWAEEVL